MLPWAYSVKGPVVDYNRIAKRVLQSLTKYGQSITLRQYSVGGSDYDAATQSTSLPIPVDSIRKGLITDQPGTRIGPQYGSNQKANTLIQEGEKWLYVDAIGPAPRVQDHIIVSGVQYCIVDVQVTGPGGIPLFYLVVCRL